MPKYVCLFYLRLNPVVTNLNVTKSEMSLPQYICIQQTHAYAEYQVTRVTFALYPNSLRCGSTVVALQSCIQSREMCKAIVIFDACHDRNQIKKVVIELIFQRLHLFFSSQDFLAQLLQQCLSWMLNKTREMDQGASFLSDTTK